MQTLRSLAAVAALLFAGLALGGCDDSYDYGPPETEYDANNAYAYEPAYYDGYVVYYDGVGRPFYYDRGVAVWVSPGSPYYAGLVHHYGVYGRYYGGWYGHDGYRYRGYRYAPGHYSYHGNYHSRGGGGRGGHR